MFPDDLKISKVTPVHKEGDKDDLNNYHPITVLPTTANFLMFVSPAVLAYDVPACAGDVSMGITVFSIGWIYSGLFKKVRDS